MRSTVSEDDSGQAADHHDNATVGRQRSAVETKADRRERPLVVSALSPAREFYREIGMAPA
jgi:hypothetical protein